LGLGFGRHLGTPATPPLPRLAPPLPRLALPPPLALRPPPPPPPPDAGLAFTAFSSSAVIFSSSPPFVALNTFTTAAPTLVARRHPPATSASCEGGGGEGGSGAEAKHPHVGAQPTTAPSYPQPKAHARRTSIKAAFAASVRAGSPMAVHMDLRVGNRFATATALHTPGTHQGRLGGGARRTLAASQPAQLLSK
jgi:hypothetical protein